MISQIAQAHQNNSSLLAVLLDPDRENGIEKRVAAIVKSKADIILVGSSLLLNDSFDSYCQTIKTLAPGIPLLIFPGTTMQLSRHADALMFLSLLSGRNADLIIGQQVHAAPLIHKMQLPVISTAYMLIESGKLTSAQFMSNTMPLPRNKPDIAIAHALAAKYMGFQMIYLEGGSGAENAVPVDIVSGVARATHLPLFTGGGIRTPETAANIASGGATVIVIGTAFEHNNGSGFLQEMVAAVHGG
jgi:phosphoglycerol geranylgeranyltransferase